MAIRFITDEKQKNWAPYLPIAQFADMPHAVLAV
jgi:hypothetical protein